MKAAMTESCKLLQPTSGPAAVKVTKLSPDTGADAQK